MPDVVCGYHLAIIRPNTEANGAFIKRIFDSDFLRANVAVLANGLTRVGLGLYELSNLVVPAPPPEEQAAIAIFLDQETAKLDKLMAEQRRLMELLKAQQAHWGDKLPLSTDKPAPRQIELKK